MVLQRLGAAFIVFVALAGCSGDDDGTASAGAPSSTTTASELETTAPATTTTVPAPPTTPPPYSFDSSVPAPPLINTGDDYEAIFESLDAYGGWLLAHNPDASLLDEAYIVGTPLYDRLSGIIATNIERSWRLTVVRQSRDVVTADVALPVVSLQVTEHGEVFRGVDGEGHVIDEEAAPNPYTVLVILQSDANGRFRIASIDPIESESAAAL